MSRRRSPKPRITDADTRPAPAITADQLASDVEQFLAAGGQIEKPAFRRDFLRKFANRQQGIRRAWVVTPPDLKTNLRGVTDDK